MILRLRRPACLLKRLGPVAITALLISAVGASQTASPQFTEEMTKGIKSYRDTLYADAVRQFMEALRLDPASEAAHLYLATSYMIQWIPGADTPENTGNYRKAKREYFQVLKMDPVSPLAMASLASMAYNHAILGSPEQRLADLAEAEKWNERRIAINPRDSEAYYYVGVINWTQAYAAIQNARLEEKMKPDDPGPLDDLEAKEVLRGKYGQTVENGIVNLTKCLDIDTENEDAMSYIGLLLREKASLQHSTEAAKADVVQAEAWYTRALDIRRMKAARTVKAPQN
ncbi:MAG: hypothetical protein WB992_07400 [Bryobacteraceae bacterium]